VFFTKFAPDFFYPERGHGEPGQTELRYVVEGAVLFAD
jgi:hypothetical protein